MAVPVILAWVPVWGRKKVLDIFAEGIRRLSDNFNVEVFAAISEEWAEQYCREKNWRYVYVENTPFGRKINTGIKWAMELHWDFLLQMGSDNLVSDRYVSELLKIAETSAIAGSSQVQIVDAKKKFYINYNYGMMVGAGRMWRRDAIEQASRRVMARSRIARQGHRTCGPGDLLDISEAELDDTWIRESRPFIALCDDDINTGVDRSSQRRMPADLFLKSQHLSLQGLIDIKTKDNIWTMDRFPVHKHDKFDLSLLEISATEKQMICELEG